MKPAVASAPALTSEYRAAPRFLPTRTFGGFAIAMLAVITLAYLSYQSLVERSESAGRLAHTNAVLERLESVQSTVKDLETGQRGFLLTGEEQFLEPYLAALTRLPAEFDQLRQLMADDAEQTTRLAELERVVQANQNVLAEGIANRRAQFPAQEAIVAHVSLGKVAMDRIRVVAQDLEQHERSMLAARQASWERAAGVSFYIQLIGSGVLIFLIIAAAFIASRDHRERENLNWLRNGQMLLAARMQGDQRLESLGAALLDFLADFLDAQRGAVYLVEVDQLTRIATYAGDAAPHKLARDTGLLGQAVTSDRTLHIRDVPAAYFEIGSSLGKAVPGELVLEPARVDGVVMAVVELGFFRRVQPRDLEFLGRVSEMLAIAVRTSQDRTRLEVLLEETQRQSEELQTQQEELRVSNEELEEQGRLLRQSQTLLEAQQTELEQSNTQLEEQAQQLEAQRDDLATAQRGLEQRAADLERSNQYKSEFLANMSHELRTPLNSTLILAKLLADNAQGNLSEEQVKFAQTIGSAGNDLLALINDILDLSKIESGKVDVNVEPIDVSALVDSLANIFEPMATARRLGFRVEIAPGAPRQIESDRQRISQMLKNLLSNALKFTERGEIGLRVDGDGAGRISFAVSDTGIGLPEHQHEIIFEAFRQADGSTHRKYGGTGLGLSISRDLARLLGGDIALRSRSGEGSVFTLSLPTAFALRSDAPALAPTRAPEPTPEPAPLRPASRSASERVAYAAASLDDDRHHLSGARIILVIEDDPPFAAILRDMVREMGFQSLVASTAEDGLLAADKYLPSAILLDMKLPDQSGLAVLDQLKRSPRTRHIPVHVVSSTDYSHEAMELGAIGYAMKPVKREEIVRALEKLEAKFSQGMRRVLVVEDDERQRASVAALLGNGDTQIVGVSTASDALAQLDASMFDCIVMDLNLPDLSGYELLEKMSQREAVSLPPVIVYTGRSLSRDEEQSLRRFSRSIIVKGARSPERLLDEVTLFLHQVESALPPDRQRMLKAARDREAALEGRRVLVVEDDVRNIFALTSVLEPKGAKVEIARNGREALDALQRQAASDEGLVDLILMDIMMPEMDGLTAMRHIRKNPAWAQVPIIALTAKAMKDDHDQCLAAGANDYIPKPLDVERLLSLIRVWMPK
jgi:CheY-like chemotaxis protein/CHASE3 domain sensor protein/putative methionine-R-sulfoxide reductase with GAF domain